MSGKTMKRLRKATTNEGHYKLVKKAYARVPSPVKHAITGYLEADLALKEARKAVAEST